MSASDVASLAKEVEEFEKRIHEEKKKLAQMRQQLPPESVNDYEFTAHDGSKVKLSELFGDRSELLLIHNMGKGCRYCTLWADGFNGVRQHLSNRAAFVLVSPDDYETQ